MKTKKWCNKECGCYLKGQEEAYKKILNIIKVFKEDSIYSGAVIKFEIESRLK